MVFYFFPPLHSCPIMGLLLSLPFANNRDDFVKMQRTQYAKTKSDIIAKADGTFVPRERRRRLEDSGKAGFWYSLCYLKFLLSCM